MVFGMVLGRFLFFMLRYGLVFLGLFCSIYELVKTNDIYLELKRKNHFLILNVILGILYFIPALISTDSGTSGIPSMHSNIWIILLVVLMINLIISFIKYFSRKPKIWIILGIICLILLGIFIYINTDIVKHLSNDTLDDIQYIKDTYPKLFYN